MKSVLKILKSNIKVTAIAHITGGGLEDNLKRVIPNNLGFSINKNTLAFSKKIISTFGLKMIAKYLKKNF